MLSVNSISLTQFKNYSAASFEFNEKIIGICGLNGKGKTNLIDAIYYSCFTKSYFTKSDGLVTQFEKDGFRIEIDFNKNDEKKKFICINKNAEKKQLFLDEVPYEKNSGHIGKFPVVMIAPDDIELINGSSEGRRKFMDILISQMDSTYLQQLILYNKLLLQRNSLLKKFAEQKKTDWPLLETFDEQMLQPCNYIFNTRKEFTTKLIPLIQGFYQKISGNTEKISLAYQSQLNQHNFFSLLNQFRQKDFITLRTNAGIHKDEISMEINDQSFKNIASQGQKKSLLFALKLGEFELLKLSKGFSPLLLLDDVFEKLDKHRMHNLLKWVTQKNDGQIFITDTHKERLSHSFQDLDVPYQIIEL